MIKIAQDRTFAYGVEYAIVRLGPNSIAPGERVLVSGGKNGKTFAAGEITILWSHTHPYITGASAADFEALTILKQSKQFIFQEFNSNPILIRKP